MEIPKYDVKDDEDNNFTQYMLDTCLEMLICAPSGSDRANLLLHMIKKLQQNKYQHLLKKFDPILEMHNIIERSNGEMDNGN